MEIQEITFYYLYEGTNQIEVSFRLTTDSDDEIRNDLIDLDEAKTYGLTLIEKEFDYINEDDEYEDGDFFVIIDEDNLFSFLNEYYIVNPLKLPSPELL